MRYKYHESGYSPYEAAIKLIQDQYEANRLDDLDRVRSLQRSLQMNDPNISNLLLMAAVNVLITSKETD